MSPAETLKIYFDREWQRFQTEAKAFAEAYPEQAGQLHLEAPSGRDPNVDHLLQGCTYLAAQIHQHIDEENNVLPEQLIMQLWPQWLQAVPSHSIAVFAFKSVSAPPQYVPAHTALHSLPVGEEKIKCCFETLDPFYVNPFKVNKTEINNDESTFTLFFENPDLRAIAIHSLKRFSLFLADDYARACELYFYLKQHCSSITLHIVGNDPIELSMLFPSQEKYRNIQKASNSGLMAHQIIFDYFSFHQQYFLVYLDGFDEIQDKIDVSMFSVKFNFNKKFSEGFYLDKNSILTNASVIVNQFSIDCEPIEYDHKQYQYPLHVDRQNSEAYQLLSVQKVEGIDKRSGKMTVYYPLYHMENAFENTFTVSRRQFDHGKEKLYLSCLGERRVPEVVSVNVLVCNGFYPKRFVLKNTLTLSCSSLEGACTATNVLLPTKMLLPPDRALLKSFIHYFYLNVNTLLSVDHLKILLHSLNWAHDPQYKKRIDGIMNIEGHLKSQVSRGAFIHVQHIDIQVHDAHFLSVADIYFFGDVLCAFFKAQTPLTQMISLTIRTYPNEEVLVWKPLLGQKNLL